jgi:hypothetical protein
MFDICRVSTGTSELFSAVVVAAVVVVVTVVFPDAFFNVASSKNLSIVVVVVTVLFPDED